MNQTLNLLEISQTEVASDIISFFRSDILNTDAAQISEQTDIISEGLIDSMGLIRLLVHLQALYGIEDFDNNDLTLDNFRTIERIAVMISKYREL